MQQQFQQFERTFFKSILLPNIILIYVRLQIICEYYLASLENRQVHLNVLNRELIFAKPIESFQRESTHTSRILGNKKDTRS